MDLMLMELDLTILFHLIWPNLVIVIWFFFFLLFYLYHLLVILIKHFAIHPLMYFMHLPNLINFPIIFTSLFLMMQMVFLFNFLFSKVSLRLINLLYLLMILLAHFLHLLVYHHLLNQEVLHLYFKSNLLLFKVFA